MTSQPGGAISIRQRHLRRQRRLGRNSREIRHLIEESMTVLDTIEAATATGPLTLARLAPRFGQLLEGYDADVIALDTNPLDVITIWGEPDRVTHVWKSGEVVKDPA